MSDPSLIVLGSVISPFIGGMIAAAGIIKADEARSKYGMLWTLLAMLAGLSLAMLGMAFTLMPLVRS